MAYTGVVHFPQDFATLQEAYNAAPVGGAVLIHPGDYTVPDQISVTKKVDFVGMSDAPDSVILRDPGDSRYAHQSVFYFGSGARCLIENISFHNKSSYAENIALRWDWQGNQELHFNKCRFVAYSTNYALFLTGARYTTGIEPDVLFTHCEFINRAFRWTDLAKLVIRSSIAPATLNFQCHNTYIERDTTTGQTPGYGPLYAELYSSIWSAISGTIEVQGGGDKSPNITLFDWDTGMMLRSRYPNYYGVWSYNGYLPYRYGILYRADKGAPRVEGPYTGMRI